MPRRPTPWLLIAATLMLSACTGHGRSFVPPAGVPGARAPVGSATLTLDLRALWDAPAARRLLAARGLPRKARITIAGTDLVALSDSVHDLGPTGTLVTLGGVPSGPRMLVKLVGLDERGEPIPGLVSRAIGAIGPGETAMPLSAMTNAAALVIESLAAQGVTAGTKIADLVDYPALDRAIPAFVRELRAASPGLLAAGAIAGAIHGANGAIPISRPDFLLAAGRIILTPASWPPGATATVVVDDPASSATLVEGKPALLGPVAPGTWTLTVVPDQAGLTPFTTRVLVAPGAEIRAVVGFGTSESQARLSGARGAAAAGVVALPAGGQALVMAGGTSPPSPLTPGPAGPSLNATVVRLPDVAAVPALALPETVAAPAAASFGGKLYWFGGVSDVAVRATGWAYDPAGLGTVTPRAGLPGGVGIFAASAASLAGRIYLAGGLTAAGDAATATMAYDPATDTWNAAGGPALVPHRTAMAGAVVGDTWYLFGGDGLDDRQAAQPGGTVRPVSRVSGWKPGFDGSWRDLTAMPTARAGAVAVAVAGRIWVIGGIGRDGNLTGAVEVYDPATDTWSLRPPLQRPRAHAAVGFLDGQIVVAGGLLGPAPLAHAAVDDVESYVP